MLDSVPRRRLALIDAVVAAARRVPLPAGIARRTFFHAYFRGVDDDDLAARDPAMLARAALAHLQFGRRRRRGETLVSVFNPQRSTHGFDSASTFVAIVTDDMPFLVDSLGIAFTARSVSVQMLVHPVLEAPRDRAGRLQELRLAGPEGVESGAPRESWQLYDCLLYTSDAADE